MTRETLALWAYTPPGGPWPLVATDYGARIEALEFTTVAPGGFGDLSCILKLPDARLPRPELGLFSRVALRDGLFTCFSGEWSDPTMVLDSTRGEYVMLSALGGGVALRDDPDDAAYTSATTAQDIIAAEFARRASYLALDGDLAAVLPDHPANTFTPVYDGYASRHGAGATCSRCLPHTSANSNVLAVLGKPNRRCNMLNNLKV